MSICLRVSARILLPNWRKFVAQLGNKNQPVRKRFQPDFAQSCFSDRTVRFFQMTDDEGVWTGGYTAGPLLSETSYEELVMATAKFGGQAARQGLCIASGHNYFH